MRLRTGIAAIAAASGAAALLAHRPAAIVRAGVREAHPHRARGVLHVHTDLSADSRGSLDQVARAARSAGLDFVMLTDHNSDQGLALDRRWEGVLVLGGLERSTSGGHALIAGTGPLPYGLDGDPRTVARDVAYLGGFVVAAHPTSSHAESAWTGGWEGLAGIEILNLAEPKAWPRGSALLWPLLGYGLDPEGTLLRSLRYRDEGLRLWDSALRERPMAGVLGSDAHGGVTVGRFWVPFPSYEAVFRLASQHLLLSGPLGGELARDHRVILDALRAGHGYTAFDALADARGFLFEARSGGRRALMGDSLPLVGEAEIRADADAPSGTTLVLLRDGHEVARGARILLGTREAGVYRVEAHLDPRLVPGGGRVPWILSNAISVFEEPALRARDASARSLSPEEPGPPAQVEPIETFVGIQPDRRWQIDRSAGSSGSLGIEAGALRFDYALGPGPRSHVSLCEWKERDLTRHTSVVLRLRSDRRMRFDLQVRTAEPSVPDGVRIFRRSVLAETEWRTAVVPFADLTSYDRRGGSPDLAHVRGIYIHLDEAHLPPGSSGTLWIDGVGLGWSLTDTPGRDEARPPTIGARPDPPPGIQP